MRRKDREVTDSGRIREIISACKCCRLGFCDDGKVYIVPLNFGYEECEGRYIFYFHGAKEGRKIDLIEKTHYAGFEMDANAEVYGKDTACTYTSRFQSVVGGGEVGFVENAEEKKRALRAIMRHNTGRADWEFQENMINAVCVFRLTVEELSCKEHL
ncbi:MAG: pyridoxamine 5'-phosphate oxidase family protein [Eubacteriales bacterium]|nr:pyridoxamine 5'-phosphate oxidase family protein [Eubacteriales bacterium]